MMADTAHISSACCCCIHLFPCHMKAFPFVLCNCIFFFLRSTSGFFPAIGSNGGCFIDAASLSPAWTKHRNHIVSGDPDHSIPSTGRGMYSHTELSISGDEEAVEYQKYLCTQFEYLLAIGQSPQRVVTYEGYRKWDEVGILLRFGGSIEQLDEAWEKAVGTTKDVADLNKFTNLHKLLPFALPMELGAGPMVKMDDYLEYVKREFTRISIVLQEKANGGLLSFDTFMRWGEVDAILAEGFLSKSALEEIWIKHTGSLTTPCNLPQFLDLNDAMDEYAE